MENSWEEKEPKPCETCGAPVLLAGREGGTRFYVPLNENKFQELLTRYTSDWFVLDRLRRAEKIIVELRKQVKEYEQRVED